MQRIIIYKDTGVSLFYNMMLRKELKRILGTGPIQTLDGVECRTSQWHTMADTLIIPGGKSKHYSQQLTGEGNASITNFIKNGGNYLGICAGGYYGCKRIEFEIGTTNEIIKEGNLDLLDCTASGTLYRGSFDESKYHQIPLVFEGKIVDNVHYLGGCYFDNLPNEIDIIATYSSFDYKPAIIKFKYGKGTVILSGVHPEMSPPLLQRLLTSMIS